VLLGGVVFSLGGTLSPAADESTRRFFEGLRSRRLFSLAENYCIRRLAAADVLTVEQRVDFTLELSRTLVEHAGYATGDEQQELWRQAQSVLDDLIAAMPTSPRRLPLEVESAFVPAAQAESLRWQFELVPEDNTTRQRAVTLLGTVLPKLRELDRTLAETLHKPPPARPGKDDLKPHELRWLAESVRFRLASSLLDQARLLASNSPDRAAALIDAEKLLKPLAGSPDDDDVAWNSRVLLPRCHRLLGDPDQALAVLEAVEKREPPAAVIDRLVAERTHVLLALRRTDDAEQRLVAHLRIRRPLPGELAYLQAQFWIAHWQASVADRSGNAAALWRQRLDQLAEQVERESGGYWAARCRVLVQQAQDAQAFGPQVAALVRAAQAAFHEARPADAIAKYGEAARLAMQQGRSDVAFNLGFTRASVQLQIKNWTEAAASFKELADKFATNPRAAEAHLLHAYALGKLADEQQTETRRQEFISALEMHRRRFAEHATSAEAAWMQGSFEDQHGQVAAALELYRLVPTDHARGPAARVAIARCHERIVQRFRESKQPTAEAESAAVTELRQMLAPDAKFPARLDDSQAEVAVRLASILLNQRPPQFTEADRWLELSLAASDLTSPLAPLGRGVGGEGSSAATARSTMALPLRIVSLAGQGRAEQARDVLLSLTATKPNDLLRIVEGLFAVPRESRSTVQRDLAELRLEAAENLARVRKQLAVPEQRRLDLCLVQAYLDTGQFRKAIEQHETFAAQIGRDPTLLRRLTEVLSTCDRPECRAKAQSTWRKLEVALTPGSSDWFDARYHVAALALELDQRDECRKLIGVTKLLYPEMGGDASRAKFLELERRCDN
jgi:outer membrane protein assembly factor BamD (BamD/ComL family)